MPSLKVEIVSFQMVIILRKLTTLEGFYRKTKIGCPNSGTPCILIRHIDTPVWLHINFAEGTKVLIKYIAFIYPVD